MITLIIYALGLGCTVFGLKEAVGPEWATVALGLGVIYMVHLKE